MPPLMKLKQYVGSCTLQSYRLPRTPNWGGETEVSELQCLCRFLLCIKAAKISIFILIMDQMTTCNMKRVSLWIHIGQAVIEFLWAPLRNISILIVATTGAQSWQLFFPLQPLPTGLLFWFIAFIRIVSRCRKQLFSAKKKLPAHHHAAHTEWVAGEHSGALSC